MSYNVATVRHEVAIVRYEVILWVIKLQLWYKVTIVRYKVAVAKYNARIVRKMKVISQLCNIKYQLSWHIVNYEIWSHLKSHDCEL